MIQIITKLRGYFQRFQLKKCGKGLIIGRNVVLNKKRNMRFGDNVTIKDYVEINASASQSVSLGNNVSLGKYSIIKCSGFYKDSMPSITVGNNFSCGDFCFFGCAGGIVIGNDVMLGQNVRFHAQNHNYDNIELLIRNQGTTQEGIVVEDDCWFGSGTVLLDGVKVGKGSVIGACTVVTKDIDPYSVVVGNPGKTIKKRL